MEEYSKDAAAANSNLPKLDKILLDVSFVTSAQIQVLLEQCGEKALSRYLLLVTGLAREGGRLRADLVNILGRIVGIPRDEFETFVRSCVDVGLVVEADGYISSPTLERDAEELQTRRERWNENKKRSRDSRKSPHGVPEESPQKEGRVPVGVKEKEKEHEQEKEEEKEQEQDPEGGPGETKPPASELERLAEDELEPLNHPDHQTSNAFINAGRRKLKRYPNIWISRPELVRVIEAFKRAGLPDRWWKAVFVRVETRVSSRIAKGERGDRIDSASWLMNWALTETLVEMATSNNAQRSEAYLKKAVAK